MKKIFFLAATLFAAMTINATELWTGEKHVSWDDGGLQIEAAKFADAVAGQKLVVSFTGASDGIEFKVLGDFHYLPGTHNKQWIIGDNDYNLVLTEPAVADLKAHGLELIGANFTVTKVALVDGDALKDGLTIWKGFFWMENWDTMELFLGGWSIDWSLYSKLIVYHEAGFDSYFMKVLSKFDNEDAIISKEATKFNDRFEVDLTAVDVAAIYTPETATWSDRLLVQGNPEGGDSFNITDIVLVPKDTTTAVENIGAEAKAIKRMANGQVVIIRDNKTYNLLGAQIQ